MLSVKRQYYKISKKIKLYLKSIKITILTKIMFITHRIYKGVFYSICMNHRNFKGPFLP